MGVVRRSRALLLPPGGLVGAQAGGRQGGLGGLFLGEDERGSI